MGQVNERKEMDGVSRQQLTKTPVGVEKVDLWKKVEKNLR